MQLDEESLNLFILDLEDDIDKIDNGLLELESNGQEPSLINRIMRAAHNIKGSSGMVGFNKMREITHAIETVMVEVNNHKVKVTRSLISLLLKCMDRIKLLKDQFLKGSVDIEVSDLVEELKKVGLEQDSPKENNEEFRGKKESKTGIPAIRPESVQNVKIKVKVIEGMINQIRELIISQTQLFQMNKSLKKQYIKDPRFKESLEMLEFLGRGIRRLQDELLQSSMTSIEVVFKNFPRMVRDLEVSLNKGINLVIENTDTRLDKNIAEEISNPLIHIIRNSADHGIELSGDRLKSGKAEKGTIRISTLQKGEQIIITVEDDGRGIDEEKVLDSAVKKGLITGEEAKRFTKREAINLIFHPGFSTADKVSEVSGRGVGMDVVLDHIEKINGTIEIESEKGKGTKITLKIPSTMSVIPSILIEINKKVLCLPAVNVDSVLSISPEDIKIEQAKEFINVNDMSIALVRLHNKFGGNPKKYGGKYYIVVVGFVEKKVAILVDRLAGSQRTIVNSLGNFLGKVRNIAGTTILEDGKIGLVLDAADLVSKNYSI